MNLPVEAHRILDATDTAPAALSAPPSVEGLWHAVRRRWKLMLGAGLAAGLLGTLVAFVAVPGTYTVQTVLHLGARPNRAGDADTDSSNYQRTQAALFVSAPILRAALDRPEVAQLGEVQAQTDALEWLRKNLK